MKFMLKKNYSIYVNFMLIYYEIYVIFFYVKLCVVYVSYNCKYFV